MNPVRAQYERFPYLPVPALPRRGPGRALAFEHGLALAGRAAPPPWGEDGWRQFASLAPAGCGLRRDGARVPGAGLVDQAEWLQLAHGSTQPWIDPELRGG